MITVRPIYFLIYQEITTLLILLIPSSFITIFLCSQVSFIFPFTFFFRSSFLMGARKDQSTSFSCLTQEEVEAFCLKWGIDLQFNPEASSLDKSFDQCPAGSVALYCKHFKFSHLCYPFSTSVLNILEYYRVSFGQLHPQGLARVLHFEVLCRVAGYDSSLLSFRCFFCLAKNGD
ncbi:hypothetical protein Hdeb2414_s0020g00554971 [Helianthus debilis subsp. tardiflorus]